MSGCVTLAPGPGAAQVRPGAEGGASYVEYRVDASAGIERFSGLAASVGARVGVRGRAELRLAGTIGRLSAQTTGSLDRDLAQAMAEFSVPLGAWFVAGAGLVVRGLRTEAARQRWTMVHAGGEVRIPFLGRRTHGVLRLAYLPVVSVAGLGRPGLAFVAGAGVEYELRLGQLRVLYTLERFDFAPPGSTRRPEQLSSLAIALRPRGSR